MPGRRRYTDEEKAAAVRLVTDGGRTSAAVARELGLNARTLASWVRADWVKRRGREWSGRVRRHFDFLTEHGFALTDVAAADWWQVSVTYRSSTSAVMVACSNEFGRVDLHLIRLVDGELPAYPIFIVDSVPLNTFHADWLLLLRGEMDEIPDSLRGLTEPAIEGQLVFWANALRELGADFLTGDLAVLDQMERAIRERARQHTQEATVWMRAGACDQAEADAVERLRTVVPDGVAVTTRRYVQPGQTA